MLAPSLKLLGGGGGAAPPPAPPTPMCSYSKINHQLTPTYYLTLYNDASFSIHTRARNRETLSLSLSISEPHTVKDL